MSTYRIKSFYDIQWVSAMDNRYFIISIDIVLVTFLGYSIPRENSYWAYASSQRASKKDGLKFHVLLLFFVPKFCTVVAGGLACCQSFKTSHFRALKIGVLVTKVLP